ncbi:Crp/Fnr family transcriptional regulator [Sphingomonas bacterium]|uniref:Crp/Fnr family transcriptional regulator n=1 Tax=Sphingomonas bacterium TaxID=1895847 RepID=UPI0015772AE3|nr:Crp/Fnr family transcriptional regulator [Sphingomonas bacterium]
MSDTANLLLAALAPDGLAAVAPHATRVILRRGDILQPAHQPAAAAFFPESGIASVVKADGHVARTEICLTGHEGFVGGALVLADGHWPYETFVQTETLSAIRIDAVSFAALVRDLPDLRAMLLRAIQGQMVQLAEGLISAAWQKVPARLARWLLMWRDRVGLDRLEITHEFIAAMIGVQRTGITGALHELEGAGLLSAGRGWIVVRDPAGLERVADGAYGVTEREQHRLVGGPAPIDAA